RLDAQDHLAPVAVPELELLGLGLVAGLVAGGEEAAVRAEAQRPGPNPRAGQARQLVVVRHAADADVAPGVAARVALQAGVEGHAGGPGRVAVPTVAGAEVGQR